MKRRDFFKTIGVGAGTVIVPKVQREMDALRPKEPPPPPPTPQDYEYELYPMYYANNCVMLPAGNYSNNCFPGGPYAQTKIHTAKDPSD